MPPGLRVRRGTEAEAAAAVRLFDLPFFLLDVAFMLIVTGGL